MMITVNIKPSTLHLVNVIVSKLTFNQEKQGRIDVSIASFLAVKLGRKQFSLLGKDKTKEYKLSLCFHEAELLERRIRAKVMYMNEDNEISSRDYYTLINFCNELHQKMT